jgi:hypothetical protein
LLPRELELDADADGSAAVVEGVVELELLALSMVPFTSTLWFTNFERSSLALALSFRPFAQELAPMEDDPVVPAVLGLVVVGFGLVVLPAVVLELAGDTFVSTKSPDELVVVEGEAVVLGVVLGVVLPVVPAALESPFWTHPVTVTLFPAELCG